MTNDQRPTWLVVLDDDPTGCQSVSDIPLLWEWNRAELLELARQRPAATFLLTNSRSRSSCEAVRIATEATTLLVEITDEADVDLRIVSRSDSTLRGHFPGEVDAIADVLDASGRRVDGVIVAPCFIEAGRYTIDNVQLVRRGTDLVPAARTEYAADATFGYTEIDVREWAATRTSSSVDRVRSIGLRTIWEHGAEGVAGVLAGVSGRQVVVANAASFGDLDLLVEGIRIAEAAGKTFVYRSGPSFVRARAGLPAPRVVVADDLGSVHGPGLVVVGSHTALTTEQLDHLTSGIAWLDVVELDIAAVLDPQTCAEEVERCTTSLTLALESRTAVFMTGRRVERVESAEGSLDIAARVATAVVEVVTAVTRAVLPAWVVAKGGITSHDVAKAIGGRRATVLGQAEPGIIPIVQFDHGDPGKPPLVYVVFPGNVGSADSLTRVVDLLERRP